MASIDMTPGNCTIDYNILYHRIMDISPYVTVWIYLYYLFYVIDQMNSKHFENHISVMLHHIWNMVLHFYIAIFYRPVAHLPMFGFQIGGITRTWGLNAIELWIFWIWVVFIVALTIVFTFYTRLKFVSKLIVINNYSRLISICTVAMVISTAVTLICGSSILLVFLSTPYVVQIKTNAFLKYQNRILFCPDFAIIDVSMWQTLLPNSLAAAGIIFLFIIMSFMATVSLLVLNKSRKTTSQKTTKSLNFYMRTLIIQVSSHLLFLFAPLAICLALNSFGSLSNFSIYTAITLVAHQGVISICIYFLFFPMLRPVLTTCVRIIELVYYIIHRLVYCGNKKPRQLFPSFKKVRTIIVSHKSEVS